MNGSVTAASEPQGRVGSAAPAGIDFSLVDSDAGWHGRAEQIRSLYAQTQAPFFATQEWLDAAWQWRATSTSLHLLIGLEGNRCRGFAPFALTLETVFGLPVRTLHFVTVPDTQFMDLVVQPADADAFAAALAEHLGRHRSQWDRLQLNYLSDRHLDWRRLAGALAHSGIATAIEAAGANPFVDLSGGFDSYYDERSRSLKKAVNLSANRLAKLGRIDVEWVRDAAAVDAALADAIRVSSVSWKQDTGNSLDRPGPHAFIERLTAHAARGGQLSLWLLRIDGKVIAIEYQLIAQDNVYALRSDFDPAFADASPGTYLNHHLLKQLFGTGLRRYYMGPGSNAYKRRWTDVGEPMFRLNAYSPTARGRALRWMEQWARPQARRLRARLRRSPPAGSDAKT